MKASNNSWYIIFFKGPDQQIQMKSLYVMYPLPGRSTKKVSLCTKHALGSEEKSAEDHM